VRFGWVLSFTLLSPAFAQEYAPTGIVRGQMVASPSERSGNLRFRSAGEAVLVCRYDLHTYIERYGQRVAPTGLKAGDPVEIVADKRPAAPCYALMVRVTDQRPPGIPGLGTRARSRAPRPALENWVPRGNITFAGVLLRANPELLIVRGRDGVEKSIVLRQDTRFVDSGVPSGLDQLHPNTRVFVRAGRNIDQELEAFQVVWGRIEGP
jgi:hypothetical protein